MGSSKAVILCRTGMMVRDTVIELGSSVTVNIIF